VFYTHVCEKSPTRLDEDPVYNNAMSRLRVRLELSFIDLGIKLGQ
jgi:hypothetical protein